MNRCAMTNYRALHLPLRDCWPAAICGVSLLGSTLLVMAQQQMPTGGAVRWDRVCAPNPVNRMPDQNQQARMRGEAASTKSFQAANAERFKQINADTRKIVQLAAELSKEVNKRSDGTLSASAMRKAALLEGLAHGVTEKMKLWVGAAAPSNVAETR